VARSTASKRTGSGHGWAHAWDFAIKIQPISAVSTWARAPPQSTARPSLFNLPAPSHQKKMSSSTYSDETHDIWVRNKKEEERMNRDAPQTRKVVHTVRSPEGGFVQYVDTVAVNETFEDMEFDIKYVDIDSTLRKILFDKEILYGGDEETPPRKLPMTETVRVKMLNDYVTFLKRKITKK
jgi:hypothetical protein